MPALPALLLPWLHFALPFWGSLSLSLPPEESALTPKSLQLTPEGDLLVPGIALTQYSGMTMKETQSPSLEPHAHL